MPTLIQHMGAISAFDEAPPAHGLSHLCCTAAVRQDRVYVLVITEAGHLLEYTLPESEIVAKVCVLWGLLVFYCARHGMPHVLANWWYPILFIVLNMY